MFPSPFRTNARSRTFDQTKKPLSCLAMALSTTPFRVT